MGGRERGRGVYMPSLFRAPVHEGEEDTWVIEYIYIYLFWHEKSNTLISQHNKKYILKHKHYVHSEIKIFSKFIKFNHIGFFFLEYSLGLPWIALILLISHCSQKYTIDMQEACLYYWTSCIESIVYNRKQPKGNQYLRDGVVDVGATQMHPALRQLNWPHVLKLVFYVEKTYIACIRLKGNWY